MPAVSTGKVLVTGANGYIAVWVVKRLLEQGYSVRGTVRSESKGTHLKEIFKEYGDKLEIVVVEDITREGAFDEAVKGVDAIEHTASPFHFRAVDPNELIGPAVAGTGSVLQSALQYGTSVKRVVVTSSCATVLEPQPSPTIFSEENHNNFSVKEIQEKGSAAAAADKYRASKTLAERAVWAFAEKHKDTLKYDVVVLNPPFVFGPILHEVPSAEDLNASMYEWYTTVVKSAKDNESLLKVGSSFIDVRDVGTAHVRALQKEEAGGQRIIIASEPYNWQNWVSAAHKIDPTLPAGNPDYGPETATYMIRYNVAKAARILGLEYIKIEQTTRDILEQFKEKGWVA